MKTNAIKRAKRIEQKLDEKVTNLEGKINELKNQVASLKALRQGYGILYKELNDKSLNIDDEIVSILNNENIVVVGDLLTYLQQHPDDDKVRNLMRNNERFAMLVFKSSLYMPLMKKLGC